MTNTSRIRFASCAALLLGLTAPAAAQDRPEKPEPPLPPPLPMEPVEFPDYESRTLRNGARLIVVPHHEQPVVSVTIAIPGGESAEPPGKEGLAGLAADLLDNGTESRTAAELAEAADFIGASLGAGAANDWTTVSLTSTTEFLDPGLDLLADILLRPTFPEDELETLRRRLLTGLQASLAQPAFLAEREFSRAVYGDHPYGSSPTPESLRGITRQDVVDYHLAWMRPARALVVVSGDVRADDIQRRLEDRLSAWGGGGTAPGPFAEPPERSERVMYFVHKPGSVQAVIRVGHPLPSATEADWPALDVANQILGGGSSAWLFKVLRAQKGYTYGAYSAAVERKDNGFFQATAEVRNEVADSAMAELLSLIQRLRRETVPAKDLADAKAFLTGSFPLRIETPGQVAGQLATTLLLGREVEWLERYRTRLGEVTAADVQRAARDYIHPERAAVVVVGDADQILDKVRPLADRVEVLDVEGEPLALDQPTAEAAPREFAVGNLPMGSFTYGLVAQGNEVGEATTTISHTTVDGRPAIRVEQRVNTPMGPQVQVAEFDPETVRPLRSSIQAGPVSGEITYANGQASGTLNLPSGPREVSGNLPEGTMVSPMDGVLIAVTDLSEPFDVPVFAPGQGIVTVSFEVVGEEEVTVPAGTFEAYEVEVGGPQPSTLWVRKAYPHILLKQDMAAQPVSIVLKSMPQ